MSLRLFPRSRTMVSSLAPAVLLLTAVASAQSDPKAREPRPEPLVATIGDVQGFIDALGAFSAHIDPSINAEQLRASGAEFGDPGFQAFAKGAGLAVVVEDLERILVAMEASGETAQNYGGMLTAFGLTEQSPAGADGPLFAATMPGMIAGPAQMAAIRALAAADRGRVEVGLDMTVVAQKYLPRLKLMAGSIPSFYRTLAPELASMGRLLEGEARFVLDVLEQVKTLRLNLDIDGQGIQLDGTVRPVAGTRLAKLAAGCEGAADLSLLGRLSSAGGVRGVMTAPQTIVTEFLVGELDVALLEMGIDPEVSDQLREMATMAAAMAGNGFAVSMYDESGGMDGSMFFQTENADAALDAFEGYARQMSEGAFSEMYASLGQKWAITFERNARKIGDTPVHRMALKLELLEGSILDGADLASLQEFIDGTTIEYAAAPGGLVGALGTTSLEELLKRAASPQSVVPLESMKIHGSGGFMYYDFDLGVIFSALSSSVPGPEGEMMRTAAKAAAGHPMTFAAFSQSGELRASIRVPAAFVGAIGRSARQAEAQQAQGLAVELTMMDLTFACDKFQSDHDRWPTSYDELTGKAPNGKTYLEKLPLDPWTKKPFLVEWDAKEYGPVFISHGADMKPGGEGVDRDIRSDDED